MGKRGLIIHFSDFTLPGGVNKVVHESLKHLPNFDIEIDLAQPLPPALGFDKNYTILEECFTGKTGLLFNVSEFVNKVVDVTKKNQYSFVVIHGHLTTTGHRIASRIRKNVDRIVLHPHYDNYVETKLARPLFPIFNKTIRFTALKCYDNVIVGSEFERLAFTQDVGECNIFVIPLGTDFESGNKMKKINERMNIVYSGHLLRRKRIDITIKVLSELSKIGDLKPKLKIIGEGRMKSDLMRLSEDLKVSHLIEWEGFLSKGELLDEISDSDIFMLFSESEAFCITVAECLAIGTPCIVANHTALSEHAVENGCMLVNYPVDPKNVAHNIASLVGKEMLVGLSGNRVKPWEDVIQRYSEVYNS